MNHRCNRSVECFRFDPVLLSTGPVTMFGMRRGGRHRRRVLFSGFAVLFGAKCERSGNERGNRLEPSGPAQRSILPGNDRRRYCCTTKRPLPSSAFGPLLAEGDAARFSFVFCCGGRTKVS